jgi:exopolysaccharide biosynthesis polyprenyl glycosylphosphotransferase
MTTLECLEELIVSSQAKKQWFGRFEALLRRSSFASTSSALVDLISALLCGLMAFQLRFHPWIKPTREVFGQATTATPRTSVLLLLLFGAYIVLLSRLLGLYQPSVKSSALRDSGATLQAVLGAGLLLCGTLYMTREYVISRVVVAATVLLTLLVIASRRLVSRRLKERRCLKGLEIRNVLIVGNGRVAHALRSHLESLKCMGFRFKGFVSVGPSDDDVVDPEVLGRLEDCVPLARSLFVDEIYFSTPLSRDEVLRVVEGARPLGIEIRVVPDLYDGLAWNAPVEYIGQFPTIPLHQREMNSGAVVTKRVLDLVIASILLLLLLPVMLVVAILIRLDSKGPIFYKAERIGRKGRLFRCYKFRTMVPDADRLRAEVAHLNERDDILFKVKNDPRITKCGTKLRKYSIDELPQLFSVLKGDMSLVGPRPPLACEVDKYSLNHLRRLEVLPGITGLWQVEARKDPSFDSYISLDTAYVENWSLMMDLRIILRTAGVVFGGTGS